MYQNKVIPPLTEYQPAKQYLFYLLSRREYSKIELQRKLDQRSCPSSIQAQLLAELSEDGLQSDHRFAVSIVKYKAAAGYGPNVIKQILKQHQITVDLDDLQAETEVDWTEVIFYCYQKKFADKPIKDYKDKQKRYRFLYSRGFPSDLIQQVF
ncbi:regulatory protein RecX [Catenovulum adriaticum]|uniref:Regulatory protein RecX n=1 Tax=Catenovulum adriaticum TaxID=2984846 RepID=A0ABY7ARW1_9ALTE|nr:regulatory protein RecX [Catenovulum sp. TS8]WAJ71230.1 recombination regulator RecX [Catenovulum sp. TS8]